MREVCRVARDNADTHRKSKPSECYNPAAIFLDIAVAENLQSLIGRVAEALDRADLFYGHGTDNPLDEAHWLVLQQVGLPVDEPIDDYTASVDDRTVERIDCLLQKRIDERVPLAYLLRSAWFAGLEFFVDERVLVPRSPIAELILDGFSEWFNPYEVTSALDLCTGSGCIGIACSYVLPNARIVATDISSDALDVARVNVERHKVREQVTLQQSDVFDSLDGRFDIIVSNPPYVDGDEMSALHPEFRREPALGLAAGDDGLVIVDRILAEAVDHLNENGLLVVEVGNSAPRVVEKYPDLALEWLSFAHGGSGVFAVTAEGLRG